MEEYPVIKKISTKSDEQLEVYKSNFPFDYHEIRCCDINRESIRITLNLQDNRSMKNYLLHVFVEHRP